MSGDEILEAALKFHEYLIANGVEDVAVVVSTKTEKCYSMNVTPIAAIHVIMGLVLHLLEKEGL